MDPGSGKATRTASKAGAATPKVSARGAKGAPTKPAPTKASECPVVPEAVQPNEQICCSTRASGYQRKGAPGPRERAQVRVRDARTETAPPGAEDAVDRQADLAEGPETPAAPERPLPRAGSGRKGVARTKKAPMSAEDAVDRLADLVEGPETPAAPERPLPRAGSRRKGVACTKKAQMSAEDVCEGQAVLAEESETPAVPESPLSGASSLWEGGVHCAGERRPPALPSEAARQRPLVPASSLGPREAAPGAWKPRAVLEKLKLRRSEILEAAAVVNKVVGHLLQRLQSFPSAFQEVEMLHTGSYYEQVKVSAPNEFDVMFKLDVPRIHLEEYDNSGAHYFVKFKRNPRGNPLNQFLEGEILSAYKMLSKFREIIKEEIKNIKDTDVIMKRKKRGCPAVTLLIKKPKEISVDIILALKVQSSWPPSTSEGMPIDNWLGGKVKRSLKQQPFYLVPKLAKEGNSFQEETWRLSFSHIEKAILKNHGDSKKCCESNGVKCCRKDCLKLMKYLLEQLKKKFEDRKELGKFCSYHMKTAFFHVCAQNPSDNDWQYKDPELCFDKCVEFFLHCLKTEHLENFFIPVVNLFSRDKIDRISKEFLSKEIEYERNNGYPIFEKMYE